MEWGEQMAAALAPERLEIHIDRPLDTVSTDETSGADNELTSSGTRTVTVRARRRILANRSTSHGNNRLKTIRAAQHDVQHRLYSGWQLGIRSFHNICRHW